MTDLGFKKLTVENWLKPDEVSTLFVRISHDGHKSPINGDDWVHRILKPTLVESVPDDVKKLYEVARGALMYGYFFYPLYMLAVEQLFRVAEAAVAHMCKTENAPSNCHTFEKRIDWLISRGNIQQNDGKRWHALRKLRNDASHPEGQMIIPPGPAMGILEKVAEDINSLFGK